MPRSSRAPTGWRASVMMAVILISGVVAVEGDVDACINNPCGDGTCADDPTSALDTVAGRTCTCDAGAYLDLSVNQCVGCPSGNACAGGAAQPVACEGGQRIENNACTATATFTPFGAEMTAPVLAACPTSPSTEAAWPVLTWGRCWSSTVTATKSIGMIDTTGDWTTTLSLTDGLGTDFYVTSDGATTTWTIYWREQDLTPTAGGYDQDVTVTVTETIADASGNNDTVSQFFTVTLTRGLFGSVSSATNAGVRGAGTVRINFVLDGIPPSSINASVITNLKAAFARKFNLNPRQISIEIRARNRRMLLTTTDIIVTVEATTPQELESIYDDTQGLTETSLTQLVSEADPALEDVSASAIEESLNIDDGSLVKFANARMHRVEGSDVPDADVYYAALTFIATDGEITVDTTQVIAKGWPKIAETTAGSYKPCSTSPVGIGIDEQAYPSGFLDSLDCAPLGSTDLCTAKTTPSTSRVDVFIPLDLGDFDPAAHSVTLLLVVKDEANNFQEFYISIAPTNGFVTWCENDLVGTGAPLPSDVLSVDFHVGVSASQGTQVTDGGRADLKAGAPVFSRTGSIIALTASAKGGHAIELQEVKVFWDFDGSVTPGYDVSYDAVTGDGTLTATHSCSSEEVCKEVTATEPNQGNLFHTYSTDSAAMDFIQPAPRSSEVTTILSSYLQAVTNASEGALYNTYLVDPTVGLLSPVQTVYVFALFKIIAQDGSARRMLLQQAGPTRGSAGAASAAVRFGVTPAAFAAYVLDISPEFVTSWSLQLQTPMADACLPAEQLMENVRTRLLVSLSSAATALRDVQIVSITVHKAGVSCSAFRPQRRRQLLTSVSVSGPFVTIDALFIFDDSEPAKPSLDVALLQAAPGVLSVLQTQSPSSVSAVDIKREAPAAHASPPAPLSKIDPASSSLVIVAAVAGAVIALLVFAAGVALFVWRSRQAASNTVEFAFAVCREDPSPASVAASAGSSPVSCVALPLGATSSSQPKTSESLNAGVSQRAGV